MRPVYEPSQEARGSAARVAGWIGWVLIVLGLLSALP